MSPNVMFLYVSKFGTLSVGLVTQIEISGIKQRFGIPYKIEKNLWKKLIFLNFFVSMQHLLSYGMQNLCFIPEILSVCMITKKTDPA